MLDEKIVQWIRSLLATGMSQRRVAQITGVSRGRVILIANNRRPDYAALRESRQQRDPFDESSPPKRCPTCGHLVYMPCLSCRMERRGTFRQPGQTTETHSAGFGNPLKLRLKDKHRVRYEGLRTERLGRDPDDPEP